MSFFRAPVEPFRAGRFFIMNTANRSLGTVWPAGWDHGFEIARSMVFLIN